MSLVGSDFHTKFFLKDILVIYSDSFIISDSKWFGVYLTVFLFEMFLFKSVFRRTLSFLSKPFFIS